MISLYRRHSQDCGQTSRRYRRCDCPVWLEGTVGGKYQRQSLKTRSWTRATKLAREIEEGSTLSHITIVKACDSFLDDARSRKLRPPSLYKYQLLFRQLKEFATNEGFTLITELDIEALRRFRATWTNKNFAARVKTENLRALFKYCLESGWIKTNPAKILKSPQTTDSPTLPFDEKEMTAILKASDEYKGKNAVLLRAFVRLLRYSGLRIRDAVTLTRERLQGDTLFLYTAKTNVPVRIPLPPECIDALKHIPTSQYSKYFFWSGVGLPKTRVANFQTMLGKIFDTAKVVDGHAHRFRDTFAVSLLLAAVPMERVSILLGHKSIRITERHYAAWSHARQEQIEADVRKTWK